VRIGIDTLAMQSPGSRDRGVGRLAQALVEAMLRRGSQHHHVLFAHDGFPIDRIPAGPNAELVMIRPDEASGEARIRDAMDRIARENVHQLDILLTLNPFELVPGYDPPNRPLTGLRVAAFVYDLIPFLFPERYLDQPLHAAWMYRRLRIARNYDALLTDSESTRKDCLRVLDLPGRRVATVGGAANGSFFQPAASRTLSDRERRELRGVGVDRPFVYGVTGIDERKNWRGLMHAFSLLPPEVRRYHQLVITCWMGPEHERAFREVAVGLGIGAHVVLTNQVPDRLLRTLYQRCSAFVFPSHYEGLGLPALEAMHCGAPVIVGENSSQPEVVGNAGVLVDSHDPAEIAARLAEVLTDRELAEELGRRGVQRAASFSWDQSADRAIQALERAVAGPSRLRTVRPRLAIVSPWPPKRSGIADYSARLVESLRPSYTIDLVHEPGYVPVPALRPDGCASYDHRLFRRHARAKGYHGVLYQMGNSFYHDHVYQALLEHGGIVTLHDFNLAGFHYWRSHAQGRGDATFRDEVRYCYPEGAGTLLPTLDLLAEEPGGMQEAFTRRALYLNRRVLDHASAVIVHSPWCREQIARIDASLAARTFVVPLGAEARVVQPEQRDAVRDRYSLPRDACIVGCFGIMSQAKMNVEAIDTFASVAGEFPEALLVFVGEDWERGEARRAVRERGLEDRTRFLGRLGDDAFRDMIAATDLGISLRRPPTYGETSAALLDLLGRGIATIVTDVATFSAYPDDVVRKVRWDQDGPRSLREALRGLLSDRGGREALGEAARRYVAEIHAWSRAAALYGDVIERVADQRRGRGRSRPATA
jgi:glycosyltransferase involved in cell wall biosynthesis